MKIIIRSKQEEAQRTPYDKIPAGMVYIAEYDNGPVALKLHNGDAVLLAYSNSYDGDNNDVPTGNWFAQAKGFKGCPAHKILGKLTEIIVEKI